MRGLTNRREALIDLRRPRQGQLRELQRQSRLFESLLLQRLHRYLDLLRRLVASGSAGASANPGATRLTLTRQLVVDLRGYRQWKARELLAPVLERPLIALDWHQTLSHGSGEVPAALVDVLRQAQRGNILRSSHTSRQKESFLRILSMG